MKTAFIFCFFILLTGCAAQITQRICYDVPVGERIDMAQAPMMEPMVDKATDMMDMEFQDMSMEDAAEILPEVVNKTFVTMFQEAQNEYGGITVGSVAAVTIQGLLNTSMGEDVLLASLQDASTFAKLIETIISNFDTDCTDNPTASLWTTLDSMLSTIVYLVPIEQLEDILVEFGIQLAGYEDNTQLWLDILTPLTTDFDASTLEGLLGLFSPDAGDLIGTFLGGLLNQFLRMPAGAETAIENVINNIQTAYGLDTSELITIALDAVNKIVQGLS